MEICKIGNATLIHGDCYQALSVINGYDCIVTDPPYGLGKRAFGGIMGLKNKNSSFAKALDWDKKPADMAPFLKLNMPTIIFGGNYFELPPSRLWLAWLKGNGMKGRSFAEMELAWCSFDGNARYFEYNPLKQGAKLHPTQKPVDVMKWCISHLPKNCTTILDPFMGSGSTGIAAFQMGTAFIGIEKDAEYFEIACRRISQVQKQQIFNF